MLIFSDNSNLPNKFLGKGIEKIQDRKIVPSAIRTIRDQIFPTKKIFSFEFKDIDYWQYLFLTENAISSQFDLLIKLNSGKSNLPDGIICIAEKGSGFHGFRKRGWDSRYGNLHLSISFIPVETFDNFHAALLIASAVSILETIDSIPRLYGKASAKWVNDITIEDSKVGGIITQTSSTGNRITSAFVGIGLNVLSKPVIIPDIFTPKASCLQDFTNLSTINLSEILLMFLKKLANNIKKINSTGYSELHRKYCERSSVIGRQVELHSDPVDGKGKMILSDKIVAINENLELVFENNPKLVRSGRLKIVE